MTRDNFPELTSRKAFTEQIDYACFQLISVYNSISGTKDVARNVNHPHRLVADRVQQFFATEELASLTDFVMQSQRKDMLVIRQRYLTYKAKNMVLAANDM